MKFTSVESQEIVNIAKHAGIDSAALFAVIAVESGGVSGQLRHSINGFELLPTIRFEGHYFHRLLAGKELKQAVALGLASPRAGAIKNPVSQDSRWLMFNKAAAINRDAAIMSCSWGVGQVMGSNWEDMNYDSADAFMKAAFSGLRGQVEMMVRFIIKHNLVHLLNNADWAGFARAYNGPNFRKFGYDKQLAKWFNFYSRGQYPVVDPHAGMTKMGSKGARPREIQSLLVRTGETLKVDGDFGPSTRKAVSDFQTKNGLTVDGVVGPETMGKLVTFRANTDENPGQRSASEIPGVRDGGITAVGGGTGAAVAADKLNSVADQIGVTGISYLDYTVTGLYVVSGALVVGGLLYAAYHYIKDKQTVGA